MIGVVGERDIEEQQAARGPADAVRVFATAIPIAAGESEFNRFDFRDLAELRAAGADAVVMQEEVERTATTVTFTSTTSRSARGR